MSRRHKAEKREVLPDPKFGDAVLSRFMNVLMYDGKKSVATRVFYDAMDIIAKKVKDAQPLEVFETAIQNVKPNIEVRSKRVGGSNYQVPIEVNQNRRLSLAIRWLVGFARERGDGKTMEEKLANELMDAANLRGGAVKKKEDVHRMAEANKAFAHYRW